MDEQKHVVDRDSLLSTRGTFRELLETLMPETPDLLGKPMRFQGDPNEADDVIRTQVDEVRSTIQKLVDSGLETRKSWFT